MESRCLVLGDIHGELDALELVFKKSAFDFNNDTLIQIGDLCDRGPASYEVVELLKKCRHLILIEGNHDQWLKNYIKDGMQEMDEMWIQQGALTTLESYERNHCSPAVHQSFYEQQVPYYIDKDHNCFVHGGFARMKKIADQDPDTLAWNRNLVQEMMAANPERKLETADHFNHIYIGHTPTIYWNESKPVTRAGITNIDTGIAKGGLLSIMDIATGQYWQSDE